MITLGTASFTTLLLVLGTLAFGPWTSFVFSFGFLGGFLLWLTWPSASDFRSIRVPYWLTLAAFVFLHRVEENLLRFQERLSELTGKPVPSLSSPYLILLVLLSVGGWLLIPVLMKRGLRFGQYLCWTFFASMGITELAHFVFPLFVTGPYRYFPGMASVVVLAPLAWWGMWNLSRPSVEESSMKRDRISALKQELKLAEAAQKVRDPDAEFCHLERAHILSQPSAIYHLLVHFKMLFWAFRQKDGLEVWGQSFRILTAVPASLFGRYPVGNTGGSNVSAFQSMPVPDDLEELVR